MMIRLSPFLLLCLLLTGCGTRENAKAALQADQAIEGAAIILARPPEGVDEADREQARRETLQLVMDLLAQARRSLAPVVHLLAAGEQIQVPTTPKQAAEKPQEFIPAASEQAGRAWGEAEEADRWRDAGRMLLSYGQALAGDWLSIALLGLGGAGGAGALIAKGISLWRQLRQTKEALTDAIKCGDDLAKADPKAPPEDPASVKAVKDRHESMQIERGTAPLIKDVLQTLKRKRTT